MESRPIENFDDFPSVETPEDVAVLYSWANLHGAKYRDFSASRREYRAQLRHRAAEQARDVELQAQAEAEAAAFAAEQNAREAAEAARETSNQRVEAQRLDALREAEHAAQIATAERMEAARRAEAAAEAEAAARREEHELAQASASARRQAALYAESDGRRRSFEDDGALPGELSDPYTPVSRSTAASPGSRTPLAPREEHPLPPPRPRAVFAAAEALASNTPATPAPASPPPVPSSPRRPQGYRPDDASGVRQIYRGPEPVSSTQRERRSTPPEPRPPAAPVYPPRSSDPIHDLRHAESAEIEEPRSWTPAPTAPSPFAPPSSREVPWSRSVREEARPPLPAAAPSAPASPSRTAAPRPEVHPSALEEERAPEPIAGRLEDPTPKRRRQDQPGYRVTDSDRAIAAFRREQSQGFSYANASSRATPPQAADSARTRRPEPSQPAPRAEAPVPAWIYEPVSRQPAAAREESEAEQQPPQTSVSDTLQRSRERVASRWYALKGVFEQPGAERPDNQPVRQKETRTPVFAVFSLAGGVGKTSLVATVGRSLSSLGEKVLLTDTTSHGLLPFYFGASELRPGTVRTFSPPSGSTDAPIYLVNYAVDQEPGNEEAQENLVEEIVSSGRGAHRILLDLTASTGWLIRRMARLNPTVLVPLAPDMNSVISLQAIEKFFHGITGPDGAPLKVFYVLNQFDASLPLHLDVREVLRRQLGDRLLPFVIRRAPAVSEALAEGMTVIDYTADAPVTEDYMGLATWLRTISAPATAGFRNVRWSER